MKPLPAIIVDIKNEYYNIKFDCRVKHVLFYFYEQT
jgi:hypothetical protein